MTRFVARAPGRVNLVGEHTDYNDGFVLPIAIDRSVQIAFEPSDDRHVVVTDAAGETLAFDLDSIGPPTGRWIDYVAGTAWSMAEAGLPARGFRGEIRSDLPMGSGLSSSAALELASALALSRDGAAPTDRMTLARVARRGENAYVGVACGLMDQFASAFGVEGAALLLDCRSLEHRAVPIDLDGLVLVVTDSAVPRQLGRTAYNDRRRECDAAVAELAKASPGVRSLRDVTPEMLDRASGTMAPVLERRARHVVEENTRVLAAVDALSAGDTAALGPLLTESHISLRDSYEVSSPELDALVEIALETPGVLGARLTGAGFGGCTITLVDREAAPALIRAIADGYPARTGRVPASFEVRPSRGAEVVHA